MELGFAGTLFTGYMTCAIYIAFGEKNYEAGMFII